MKKMLVISNDIDSPEKARGPHTFRIDHKQQLEKAAGNSMSVVIAAPEDAPSHFSDAEVIAAFPTRIPDISQTAHVKWLHSFSAGVDRVLTPEVISSNVVVTNSSGIHATPIAEHIIGLVLMFVREFHVSIRDQARHVWAEHGQLGELRGKHVLIVGLGEIGTETARILSAFGVCVSAISRSAKEKPAFVEYLGQSPDLDAQLSRADIVIITLPGTEETHHLFDAKKFALMSAQGRSASGGKNTSAYIINIGRGSIIKETELIEALQNKTIAGAGLDVTEQEPLSSKSPLWDMPNVIITPHHSGLSEKYMDRGIELLCKNVHAYINGEKLPNEVNKTLGY